jgi:hypothetical protein
VLEASLSGVGRVAQAYDRRRVAGDGEACPACGGENREVCLAGAGIPNLHEVRPQLVERIDGAPRIRGGADANPVREHQRGEPAAESPVAYVDARDVLRALEHRPGRPNPGADERAPRHSRLPGPRVGDLAAHLADAGDAVRDEQRERALAGVHEVHVHVPEARHEVTPRAVDDARRGRHSNL